MLAEQAMKTEQLETVVVGAKAAQEHAEQQVEQLQSELQTVQAELASLKQEADTEKVRAPTNSWHCTSLVRRCCVASRLKQFCSASSS